MKTIPGFWGHYQIDEYWNVDSLKFGKIKRLKFRNCDGYHAVILCYNKRQVTKKIHQLVWLVYIPNPDNKPCVLHKKRNDLSDPMNNHVSNLYWWTKQENAKDCVRDWTHASCTNYWKFNTRSRQILQIDRSNIVASFWGLSEAAKATWAHATAICECCNWKRKTAWWFAWQFSHKA